MVRQKAQQITTGVRCGVMELGLHWEGSEEPLEGWDGQTQTCRRLQKIPEDHLRGSVDNKPREATEKAIADSCVCRGSGGQKLTGGIPPDPAGLQEGAGSQACHTQPHRWRCRAHRGID